MDVQSCCFANLTLRVIGVLVAVAVAVAVAVVGSNFVTVMIVAYVFMSLL